MKAPIYLIYGKVERNGKRGFRGNAVSAIGFAEFASTAEEAASAIKRCPDPMAKVINVSNPMLLALTLERAKT